MCRDGDVHASTAAAAASSRTTATTTTTTRDVRLCTDATHAPGCGCGGSVVSIPPAAREGRVRGTLTANATAADVRPSGRVAQDTRRNLVPAGLERFTEAPLPKQPPCEDLSPRVTCVLGSNPGSFTLNGTNLYLVGTGKRRILIDTGELGPREKVIASLRAAMRERGVEGLDHLIITHLHHDHTALWEVLQREFGPLRISKWASPAWEYQRRRDVVRAAREKEGIPDNDPRAPKELTAFLTWIGLDFLERSNFHVLSEGEVISTQGASLRAFWTPGHAADHVVLFLEEEKSLFTGDLVLGWGTSWVEDLALYVQSLHKVRLLQAARFYPGHGPCVHDAPQRIARYIAHRDAREVQVNALLREVAPLASASTSSSSSSAASAAAATMRGVTSRELTRQLYPELSTEAALEKAEGNVLKILIKLRKDGVAMSLDPEIAVARSSLDESDVARQTKETGSDGNADPKVPVAEFEKRWFAVVAESASSTSSSSVTSSSSTARGGVVGVTPSATSATSTLCTSACAPFRQRPLTPLVVASLLGLLGESDSEARM